MNKKYSNSAHEAIIPYVECSVFFTIDYIVWRKEIVTPVNMTLTVLAYRNNAPWFNVSFKSENDKGKRCSTREKDDKIVGQGF